MRERGERERDSENTLSKERITLRNEELDFWSLNHFESQNFVLIYL